MSAYPDHSTFSTFTEAIAAGGFDASRVKALFSSYPLPPLPTKSALERKTKSFERCVAKYLARRDAIRAEIERRVKALVISGATADRAPWIDIFKIFTGAGKTVSSLRGIILALDELIRTGTEPPQIIFSAPEVKLIDEIHLKFNELLVEMRASGEIYSEVSSATFISAASFETSEGVRLPVCQRPEYQKPFTDRGLPAHSACWREVRQPDPKNPEKTCKVVADLCPLADICRYGRQMRLDQAAIGEPRPKLAKPHVLFVTTASITTENRYAPVKERKVVILDENYAEAALNLTDAKLSLSRFAIVAPTFANAVLVANRQEWARKGGPTYRSRLMRDHIENARFESWRNPDDPLAPIIPGIVDELREARTKIGRELNRRKALVQLSGNAADADAGPNETSFRGFGYDSLLAALTITITALEWLRSNTRFSARLNLYQGSGPADEMLINAQRPRKPSKHFTHREGKECPTIMLSATPCTPRHLQLLTGRPARIVMDEAPNVPAHGGVIQILGAPINKGSDATSNRDKALGTYFKTIGSALSQAVQDITALHPEITLDSVSVVTHLALKEAVVDGLRYAGLKLPPDTLVSHFGANIGSNASEKKRLMLVVGEMRKPPDTADIPAYEMMTNRCLDEPAGGWAEAKLLPATQRPAERGPERLSCFGFFTHKVERLINGKPVRVDELTHRRIDEPQFVDLMLFVRNMNEDVTHQHGQARLRSQNRTEKDFAWSLLVSDQNNPEATHFVYWNDLHAIMSIERVGIIAKDPTPQFILYREELDAQASTLTDRNRIQSAASDRKKATPRFFNYSPNGWISTSVRIKHPWNARASIVELLVRPDIAENEAVLIELLKSRLLPDSELELLATRAKRAVWGPGKCA